jgi:uncharacterized protein (DUF2236 family)
MLSAMKVYDHPARESSDTMAAQEIKHIFDPASKIWQVHRELVLLLAGGRALLMQLAHPKVAAGVAAHSRFQEDPLGRLYRTMSRMWSIVFDEESQARAALRQVAIVHKRVQGTVPATEASHAGAAYDASDQDLLLWVHATLIDSAMVAYDLLVEPLNAAERAAYYSDSRRLAALFGIHENNIPASIVAFDSYMNQTIASGEILPGPMARSLAVDVLYPRPYVLRPAAPLFRLMTAGLLPAKLRDGYGLKWNLRREKKLLLAAKAIRSLLPVLPSLVRIVPRARTSERVSKKLFS